MHVHVHIHTYIYIHVLYIRWYTHVYTYIYTTIHMCTHTYTLIHTCIHIHIHYYTHVYTYIYTTTHMYTHTYTLIHTCIHIHIHYYTHVYTYICVYIYRAYGHALEGAVATRVHYCCSSRGRRNGARSRICNTNAGAGMNRVGCVVEWMCRVTDCISHVGCQIVWRMMGVRVCRGCRVADGVKYAGFQNRLQFNTQGARSTLQLERWCR